ncbi:hypothetical protein FD722_06795 [Photobacterium damselae subsp. damselae]|uniref:hypothetical protein n=1 Tax=Photobacterium damselae TaxID=38293 RepID=UPI0010FE5C9D|nr:hypothetical protein [Photobacterium damselae]TLS83862.1 hypothetical protein FD719_05260 [Photobacterium damselae subsp. damselae]TLS91054.1 hypothetical protein FD722_06795 [Photobacterium damselae subsp. damselae]
MFRTVPYKDRYYGRLSGQNDSYPNLTEQDIRIINKLHDNQDIIENRRLAYRLESDPLFLEWQYDQTSEKEQAWRDKVAEIKTRYPLPTKE